MPVSRSELEAFFGHLLSPSDYADYGPNGLQIEGTEQIDKIAFAVSATRKPIQQAVDSDADALVVHHGLFWKFHGPRTITGPFARRVTPLIRHGINLLAYHLPLDGHPEIGNAAVLGRWIGLQEQQPFGDHQGMPTGVRGLLRTPVSAARLKERLAAVLEHPVILATPDANQGITSIGIITGGANSDWLLAHRAGLDAYITGEISEHDWHESQEHGLHMFAGGHNATEQLGIQALLEKTREQFGLPCLFIPSENPA